MKKQWTVQLEKRRVKERKEVVGLYVFFVWSKPAISSVSKMDGEDWLLSVKMQGG